MGFSDWIVGTDPGADDDMIAHIVDPWFSAKFIDDDLAGTVDEEQGDEIGFYAGDTYFYAFRWAGEPPPAEVIADLCEEAALAIRHIEDVARDDQRIIGEGN